MTQENNESYASRLFVGNLPFSITETDLREFFQQAGNVMRIYMPATENGQSRGFAFVQMSGNIDAQVAIFRFDGSQFEDRRLTVAFAKQQRRKAA